MHVLFGNSGSTGNNDIGTVRASVSSSELVFLLK